MDNYVERDAVSYLMSGTIFSATFAGSMNLSKYKKKEITKREMIQDTTKLAVQGGIGTGSAVAATNCIGKGDYLNAMLVVGLGAIGVYGTEKISEMVEKSFEEKKKKPIEKWTKEEREEAIKNAKVKSDG